MEAVAASSRIGGLREALAALEADLQDKEKLGTHTYMSIVMYSLSAAVQWSGMRLR
jgi:hypothetical protein